VYQFIQEQGKVDRDEMYRVFNMGIGYVVFVRRKDVDLAMSTLKTVRAQPKVIGRVVRGSGVTLS
jgi:phosphoribosylformylglycinamidine cyclo-ligase